MDSKKWFPLKLSVKTAKKKTKKTRAKNVSNNADASITTEDVVDETAPDEEETDLTASEESSAVDEQSQPTATSETLPQNATGDGASGQSSSVATESSESNDLVNEQSTTLEPKIESLVPSARIQSHLAVSKNLLYLYGGVVEAGSREITLNDLHCLNLHKLDTFECLLTATVPDWFGEESGDEDDDEEEGDEDSDESDEDDSDDSEDEEVESETISEEKTKVEKKSTPKVRRGNLEVPLFVEVLLKCCEGSKVQIGCFSEGWQTHSKHF